MKIYYFVHIVGRDQGNSGIPRVSRNLGRALADFANVTLVPVRWDAALSAIVHAEQLFLDTMMLHGGPRLKAGREAGLPIHQDKDRGDRVLVPEVTHLGTPDPDYPSFQFPLLSGYAKQHEFRLAAIFHDAMPLTHFGEEESNGQSALSFMAYTFGLSGCDIILPVSRASSTALTTLFARYGVAPETGRVVRPVLLPEEMIGKAKLQYLPKTLPTSDAEIVFCMWGTIFPHKNYLAAMEAFNRLCSRWPDKKLMLHHIGSVSGACTTGVARLVRHSKGRIRLHGFVSDEKLGSIVQSSRASVFVSTAEGYGLPLSESLWLGLPCITSNMAPMTEIAAGGGALLVDPTDIDAIANAMETFVTNAIECNKLHEQLRTRHFRTWQSYAEEVLAAISESERKTDNYDALTLAYTPSLSRRSASGMEILAFDMSEMHAPPEYERMGVPLIASGNLNYNRDTHGSVEHGVICFGPYATLGAGRYIITFDGVLDGHCRVQVTSDEGRKIHADLTIDTISAAPEFTVESKINKFEIVIFKNEDLKHLSMQTIWLTRSINKKRFSE